MAAAVKVHVFVILDIFMITQLRRVKVSNNYCDAGYIYDNANMSMQVMFIQL